MFWVVVVVVVVLGGGLLFTQLVQTMCCMQGEDRQYRGLWSVSDHSVGYNWHLISLLQQRPVQLYVFMDTVFSSFFQN